MYSIAFLSKSTIAQICILKKGKILRILFNMLFTNRNKETLMSSEDDKVKHSRRIHQKHNYIHKQLEIAKAFNIEVKEPHYLAKHSVLNCGDPKCIMCSNPRKVWKEKTIQEKRFEQINE